jgi:hypothetical protein
LSADPTARTRKSFWFTTEDLAALFVMAGGEGQASRMLRELIREAWARWPANQPQVGAVPTIEMETNDA